MRHSEEKAPVRVAGGRKRRSTKKEMAEKVAEQRNEVLQNIYTASDADKKKAQELLEKQIEKIFDKKMHAMQKQVNKAARGAVSGMRVPYKFTVEELINLFGGWFTLTYAFSIPGKDGCDEDFYICSQDVSGINVNDRPKLNEAIKRKFGKDVYGFAIIASSNAF